MDLSTKRQNNLMFLNSSSGACGGLLENGFFFSPTCLLSNIFTVGFHRIQVDIHRFEKHSLNDLIFLLRPRVQNFHGPSIIVS